MDLDKILSSLEVMEQDNEIEDRRSAVTDISGEVAIIRQETEERESTIKELNARISHLQDVNNNLNLQLRAQQGNPSDYTTPHEEAQSNFDVASFFG